MPALVRLRAMVREPQSGERREPLIFWTAYGAESLLCDVAAVPTDSASTAALMLVSIASAQAKRPTAPARRRRTRGVTAAAQRYARLGRGRGDDDQDRPRHPQRLCRRTRQQLLPPPPKPASSRRGDHGMAGFQAGARAAHALERHRRRRRDHEGSALRRHRQRALSRLHLRHSRQCAARAGA